MLIESKLVVKFDSKNIWEPSCVVLLWTRLSGFRLEKYALFLSVCKLIFYKNNNNDTYTAFFILIQHHAYVSWLYADSLESKIKKH